MSDKPNNDNPSAEEKPVRLGQLLLRHTTLTESQLEDALAHQKAEGGMLGQILIKKNYVLPHEIMRVLCIQLGLRFVEDLKPDEIDPILVENIPMGYSKSKEIIPIAIKETPHGQTLVVATSDPFNVVVLDDLRALTGMDIEPVISTRMRIEDAINRVYEKRTTQFVDDIEGDFEDNYDLEGVIDILEANENDASVISYVNSLLIRAVKEKTSDIHIEPYEKEFVVRFRRDGVLSDIDRKPKKIHAAVSSRIKIMGNLDIAEKRLPQDGRIKRRMAGKEIDVRLSTVPTLFGERLVMRILEQTDTVLALTDLGFTDATRQKIEKLIAQKYGIILVTGPTGSGKSTTLAACLSMLNSPDLNIMTVEDPVEYQIKGINQVQVNHKIELDFKRALRQFLRQDPDVIMVGEIRDKETAEIAINASLTGHLVLSTLHTNDAPGAITRMTDMGVEPFLVASSLLGVEAQRLIRKLCTECKVPHVPTEFEKIELGLTTIPEEATIFKSVGCPVCTNTGYKGRMVIHELMMVDDEIRSLIIRENDTQKLKKMAVEKGMTTLREDGMVKVLAGITSIDELMRVTQAEA